MNKMIKASVTNHLETSKTELITPRSLIVHIPERPTTSPSKDFILNKIMPPIRDAAAREKFVISPQAAVRVNIICCLPSDAADGSLIAGTSDYDNLAIPILSAAKQAVGGPIPDNAANAVAAVLKTAQSKRMVNGKRLPGYGWIVEFQILDPKISYLGAPYLGHFRPNRLLKRFGYAPLLPAKGLSNTLEFSVRGPIPLSPRTSLSAQIRESQIGLLKEHILQLWIKAAEICKFPRKIDPEHRLHITTLYLYSGVRTSDPAQKFLLKISAPDMLKILVKFTNDSFSGDPINRKDQTLPLPNDVQFVGGTHIKALTLATPDNPFPHEEIFFSVKIGNRPKDFKPPGDIEAWMNRCIANSHKAEQLALQRDWAEGGENVTTPLLSNGKRPARTALISQTQLVAA